MWWIAAAVAGELEWKWPADEHRRYFVENEVSLPNFVWLVAERNREARVVAWQLQTILDCVPISANSKGWEINCHIDDIGIRAAAMPADSAENRKEPLLPEILEEVDGALTGATLQLVLKKNGRVENLDIEGLVDNQRRLNERNEVLRMLLWRTVAGFDLQLPRKGMVRDPVWIQTDSQLMKAPNQAGSLGGEETAHQLHDRSGNGWIIITAGRGTLSPMSTSTDEVVDRFDAKMTAATVFDIALGQMTERIWTVSAWPTASSASAMGSMGVPYFQNGRLQYLGSDPAPSVGLTYEIAPPGETPSTLQAWQPLPFSPMEADTSVAFPPSRP